MATLATGLLARFGRAGFAPAGFHQEVSPFHLRFLPFHAFPSAITRSAAVKRFSSSFLNLRIFFLLNWAHPCACAGGSVRRTDVLPSSISALCSPYALNPVTSSL